MGTSSSVDVGLPAFSHEQGERDLGPLRPLPDGSRPTGARSRGRLTRVALQPLSDREPQDVADDRPASNCMGCSPPPVAGRPEQIALLTPAACAVARGRLACRSTRRPLSAFHAARLRLPLLLRLVLLAALILFAGRAFAWSELPLALQRLSCARLLLGWLAGFVGVIVSAYQWRALLLAEGLGIDLAELVKLYLVGIAFNHCLPAGMGGDVFKALWSGRRGGSYPAAVSALLMSRLTGLLAMLGVLMGAILLWHAAIPALLTCWVVLLIGVICLGLAGLLSGAQWLCRVLGRRRRCMLPLERTADLAAALRRLSRSPRALSLALAFGLCFWVVACLNYYGCALALGIDLPLACYFVAVPLVALIASLPLSINGLGLREGALLYFLALWHVATRDALLLACCIDLQGLLFGLLGGGLYITMRKGKVADGSQSG